VTSRGGALFFFGFGASRDYSSRSDHEARAKLREKNVPRIRDRILFSRGFSMVCLVWGIYFGSDVLFSLVAM